MSERARIYVTTSWDDGDPADLRLAESLVRRDLAGTFYLCRDFGGGPRLTNDQIRELSSFPKVEVGAHTLSHPDLRKLRGPELRTEVEGSKQWLEDILGAPVSSFCYPRGLFNKDAVGAVRDAGYAYARTTMSSHTGIPSDLLSAGTTLQLFPHPRHVQLRHAAKGRDLEGFRRIAGTRHWSRQPAALARSLSNAAVDAASLQVLHLWGHSWELNRHDLWAALDDTLAVLEEIGSQYITNRSICDLSAPA